MNEHTVTLKPGNLILFETLTKNELGIGRIEKYMIRLADILNIWTGEIDGYRLTTIRLTEQYENAEFKIRSTAIDDFSVWDKLTKIWIEWSANQEFEKQ